MHVFDGNKIEFKFDESRERVSQEHRGKQCFVYKGDLVSEVAQKFGREAQGLCLKVFFTPIEGHIDDYYWGTPWRHYSLKRCEEIGRLSRLVQTTTIQNWLWMENLAPRVYGLVLLERNGKQYPAQLTEYIEGEKYETVEEVQAQLDVIEKKLEKFKCMYAHRELIGRNDFIDGKVIDLQGYRWTAETKGAVKKFVEDIGKYGKTHYQDINQIGITGRPRKTLIRIEAMKLEEIDFKGKDVLDVGCNSGAFCMYAANMGAKRITGVDLHHHIRAANALAFFLGYHNIDYISADILKDRFFVPDVDITFFLSMNVHVGFPDWVYHVTKELLIFEENAKQSKFRTEYWDEVLSKYFNDVKLVGTTNDQNERYHKPIFHCRKL